MSQRLSANWAKKNAVVIVAIFAALFSSLFVAPDGEYVEYFDFRTLVCLFCAMAVVAALDNAGLIRLLAGRAIHFFGTRRTLIVGLVFLTSITAMFASNDVALLTFLPLTFVALASSGNEKFLAFAFVMETAAANLGGMILPFGSPQNLFLYSFYEIPTGEFVALMAVPFAISMALIFFICLFVPNEEIRKVTVSSPRPSVRSVVIYGLLFALTICIVLRLLPIWTGAVVPIALLFVDKSALAKLDWGLLLTFVAFFIFAGNVARIDAIDDLVSDSLNDNVLIWSAIGSQVISNVPAAILFAQFTDSYRELLVGVNIGGVGTIVASLANLIALAKYREYQPGNSRSFMVIFSTVNFGLLVALLAIMSVVFALGVL